MRISYNPTIEVEKKLEKEKAETGLGKNHIITVALLEYFTKRGK